MTDLITAFGFRIVEVPDLTDHVCVVPSQGLVLIRAGLSAVDIEDVTLRLPTILAATGKPAR